MILPHLPKPEKHCLVSTRAVRQQAEFSYNRELRSLLLLSHVRVTVSTKISGPSR